VWGAQGYNGPAFIPSGAVHVVGDVSVGANRLWTVAISAVVLGAVGLFFTRSRHGVAMRAVADDQQAAMVQGINVNRIFAMAWAMAGAVGAIGGLLLASISGSYGRELEIFGILVFPVVILGGLDSVLGTVVGGVIVGLLVEYTKSYVNVNASEMLPYFALIAILLVKPYGLFGKVEIERV
jgi:branched-chain amino acid transport system permease protein